MENQPTERKSEIVEYLSNIYQKVLTAKDGIEKDVDFPEKERKLLLRQFRQMEIVLGSFVESISSVETTKAKQQIAIDFGGYIRSIYSVPDWKSYFEKRLGKETINPNSIGRLWDKIHAFSILREMESTR